MEGNFRSGHCISSSPSLSPFSAVNDRFCDFNKEEKERVDELRLRRRHEERKENCAFTGTDHEYKETGFREGRRDDACIPFLHFLMMINARLRQQPVLK